jgi:DNA-binding Xre family transcriptional regulator
MDPEKIMTGISKEIEATLKAMEKAKNPEEKLIQSKTVKNLCESLGVFLSLAGDMMPYDENGEPIPF